MTVTESRAAKSCSLRWHKYILSINKNSNFLINQHFKKHVTPWLTYSTSIIFPFSTVLSSTFAGNQRWCFQQSISQIMCLINTVCKLANGNQTAMNHSVANCIQFYAYLQTVTSEKSPAHRGTQLAEELLLLMKIGKQATDKYK